MRSTSIRITAALMFAGLAAGSALAQTDTITIKKEAITQSVRDAGEKIAQAIDRTPEEIQKIVSSMKEAKKAEMDKPAPDFKLVDTKGKEYLLSDFVAAGNIVVLEWFNPQCPYVKEHYNSEGKGTSTAVEKEFKEQKVVWLRINSSDPNIREGTKEFNDQAAAEWKISGPILLDADGKVGKAYGAKVTPTLVVISSDGVVSYEGMMDSESSPSKTGEVIYPRDAVKSLLAQETVDKKYTKAVGCGIKFAKKTSD